MGVVGNGFKGEIEAAECAVPLRVREWLALTSSTVSAWVRSGEGRLD